MTTYYLISLLLILNAFTAGILTTGILTTEVPPSQWWKVVLMFFIGLPVVLFLILYWSLKPLGYIIQIRFVYYVLFTDKYKNMSEEMQENYVEFTKQHIQNGGLKSWINPLYASLLDKKYKYNIVKRAKSKL